MPTECPNGGGGAGYIRKDVEKGYLEHPSLQSYTDDMFEIFVRYGRYPLLSASFCQQAATVSAYKSTQRAVASPDAPQKPLVRKRARGCKLDASHPAHICQPSKKASYCWFTPTCMHPQGTPYPVRRRGHRFCKPVLGSQRAPYDGWVLVKACRLQDCGKLKKCVPIHKQGSECPNGVPALVDRGHNDDESDSE